MAYEGLSESAPEEQLFKWVKASEHLPNLHDDVLVRTNAAKKLAEAELYLGYYDEDIGTGETHFTLVNFHHHEFDTNDFDSIEWLCPAPSPSAEVEALRRELEASKAVIERLAGLYRTDFLDTCEENGHSRDTCQELWKQYCIANQIPNTPKNNEDHG